MNWRTLDSWLTTYKVKWDVVVSYLLPAATHPLSMNLFLFVYEPPLILIIHLLEWHIAGANKTWTWKNKSRCLVTDRQNGGQSGEDTASQCSLFLIIHNHKSWGFIFDCINWYVIDAQNWSRNQWPISEPDPRGLGFLYVVIVAEITLVHQSPRYRSRASHQTLISAFNLGVFVSTDVLFESFRSSWDFCALQSGEKNKKNPSWSAGEKNMPFWW